MECPVCLKASCIVIVPDNIVQAAHAKMLLGGKTAHREAEKQIRAAHDEIEAAIIKSNRDAANAVMTREFAAADAALAALFAAHPLLANHPTIVAEKVKHHANVALGKIKFSVMDRPETVAPNASLVERMRAEAFEKLSRD